MPPPQLTEDEIIETLKRSSLPTLVTEGRDDYLVFRKLEERLSHVGLSVLPVGGRTCLLGVFSRRAEIGRTEDVAFLADRDLWVLGQIPEEYLSERLVFTDGYSIENDLYRDGNIERLMTVLERQKFSAELSEFLRWYSFAAQRVLDGEQAEIAARPERVLSAGHIDPLFAAAVGFDGNSPPLFEQLLQSYPRTLRGKSLLALLMRQLSYPTRPAKHRYDSLLEMCAIAGGPHMQRMHDLVAELFATAAPPEA